MRNESVPPPGLTFLDHTADVGVQVEAGTLPDLFVRAAIGMKWLLQETEGVTDDPHVRRMTLGAADLPTLLRAWLRELLYWHETEGVSFVEARFDVLTERRLGAEVTVAHEREEPVREIKGVTLHGLEAERRADGWVGRIIFDV